MNKFDFIDYDTLTNNSCHKDYKFLIGGRGHSKTKEVIEDMQKEIERLNNIIEEKSKMVYELRTYIEHNLFKYFDDEKKYKKCRDELYKIILKEQVKKDNHILGCDCSKKDKEIERLSKEVDMWNKKYNEQIDIINELEKFLNDYVKMFKANDIFRDRLLFTYAILDKLKELKEGK